MNPCPVHPEKLAECLLRSPLGSSNQLTLGSLDVPRRHRRNARQGECETRRRLRLIRSIVET